MTTSRILILFAHPALQKSRVQSRLAAAVRGLDGVTFHDLYEEYPDLHIDVDREQQLLTQHDIIIWQHPFYWYSSPAIIKEWIDLVLEWGFAYGEGGDALRGKKALTVISSGGTADSYRTDGLNRFSVRQLLAPMEQTAVLCGMRYLPPWVLHAVHRLSDGEIEAAAAGYRGLLEDMRDGRVDWNGMAGREFINQAPQSAANPY